LYMLLYFSDNEIDDTKEGAPSFVDGILKERTSESEESKKIKIIFEIKKTGENVIIESENSQRFKEVSLKFQNKVLWHKEDITFIFKGIKVDPEKTIGQLGIKNGSKILVITPNVVEGAGAFIGNILEDSTNEIAPIVIFIFEGVEAAVCCKPNEKFKEVSLRYKDLMSQKEEEEIVFLFNGQVIKPEKTLDELGIKNKSRILVMINENQNQVTPESESYKNILDEKKSSNTLNKLNDSKNEEKIEKKNEPKKYNLNILYYDENLKNKENNDNCTFFEMNTYGAFYGCHYFELFKTVCKKIKNNKKEFILISSGSCAQKNF